MDSLKKAAADIGCELVEGQKTYRWWGHSVGDYPLPEGFTAADLGKCEHAIKVKGAPQAYEIGVIKARKPGAKGYTLLWDFYAGGYGLQKAVGEGAGLLRQAYSARVAEKQLRKKGYQVSKTTDVHGRVVLRAR